MVKLWWPFIQSDSLLFHVALLLSSLSLEEAKHQKEGNRARHLLGGWNSRQIQAECIRQLSDRVQDQALGTSDQTIVAVANLAAIEVSYQIEVTHFSIAEHLIARKREHENGSNAYGWAKKNGFNARRAELDTLNKPTGSEYRFLVRS